MLTQKGKTKTWFNFGIEEFLAIRVDTIEMTDVDLRLDTLKVDLFPFSITVTQQNAAQVTFSLDFFLAQLSFTASLGRLFS